MIVKFGFAEQCSLSGEEANLAGENGLAESSPSKRPRIEEDALQGEEAAHAGVVFQ